MKMLIPLPLEYHFHYWCYYYNYYYYLYFFYTYLRRFQEYLKENHSFAESLLSSILETNRPCGIFKKLKFLVLYSQHFSCLYLKIQVVFKYLALNIAPFSISTSISVVRILLILQYKVSSDFKYNYYQYTSVQYLQDYHLP